MILNKKTSHGSKGKTVCYTLANLRFDETDSKLKWDPFRFYTPLGDQTDGEGFTYFDVPVDEILIERDDTLNKGIEITVSKAEGTVVTETYEGAEPEAIVMGLEGDILVSGYIPADTQAEITLDYMEVTHGTV